MTGVQTCALPICEEEDKGVSEDLDADGDGQLLSNKSNTLERNETTVPLHTDVARTGHSAAAANSRNSRKRYHEDDEADSEDDIDGDGSVSKRRRAEDEDDDDQTQSTTAKISSWLQGFAVAATSRVAPSFFGRPSVSQPSTQNEQRPENSTSAGGISGWLASLRTSSAPTDDDDETEA